MLIKLSGRQPRRLARLRPRRLAWEPCMCTGQCGFVFARHSLICHIFYSWLLLFAGLKKKLKDLMGEFSDLRNRIQEEYREVVERRLFTVTGL